MSDPNREDLMRVLDRLGYEPSKLQWKWRNVSTLPTQFDITEAEAALMDALVTEGGCTVWRGDGLSCAAQIVQAVWNRSQGMVKLPTSVEEAELMLRLGMRYLTEHSPKTFANIMLGMP